MSAARIKSVPNQKIIITNKVKAIKPFTTRNIKIERDAIKNLAPAYGALSLWLYMSQNSDGYEYSLSYEAVNQSMGTSICAYKAGVKTLIEKGYLLHIAGNKYGFYEFPSYESHTTEPSYESHTTGSMKVIPPVALESYHQSYESHTRNTINTINQTIYTIGDDSPDGHGMVASPIGESQVQSQGQTQPTTNQLQQVILSYGLDPSGLQSNEKHILDKLQEANISSDCLNEFVSYWSSGKDKYRQKGKYNSPVSTLRYNLSVVINDFQQHKKDMLKYDAEEKAMLKKTSTRKPQVERPKPVEVEVEELPFDLIN